MSVPGWRDWIFAIKTFAAAMLALTIALWVDLPRPYWAMGTVFITSQVLAGATHAKASYRVLGTLVGAVAAVILVPRLVNAPEMLCLAMALWVAGCLYLSLLDRTPASYLPMLAGYTAAIIGFPAVAAPGAIFDTAVARAEEITLGILCASLVSTIVLPQAVAPVIASRLDLWLDGARAWVVDVLARRGAPRNLQATRLRLAADAIGLDALAIPLRHDRAGRARSGEAMAILRQDMLMFLPIVTSIADRIDALARTDALPASVQTLLADMADWLASGNTDAAVAARLRDRARAADPALVTTPSWTDLLLASLVARLVDFIDLRQDSRRLLAHVRDAAPIEAPLAFRYTTAARTIRHRDHGMALLSAAGVFLAVLLTCGIWIATGWPDGAAAPMMAAVACSFFATQDDPAPFIISFANSAIIGSIGAAAYLFGVLPVATNLEMVVLALAPGLVLCGVFMAQPRTAPMAMGIAVNGATALAITSTYSADFASFVNSSIALVVGMWCAAIVTRLMRSMGGARVARRLWRTNRRSLARAADPHAPDESLALAALMLDRIGLIAPRLSCLPPDDAEWTVDLITDVRIGINLVGVRMMLDHVNGDATAAVLRVLSALARHYRTSAPHPPGSVLSDIDAVLEAVARDGHDDPADTRKGLLALVGLRRGLFPQAPAFGAPALAIPTERAA